MCSYKVVEASFEVWGIQSKAEEYIQKVNTNVYFQYKCHTILCARIVAIRTDCLDI